MKKTLVPDEIYIYIYEKEKFLLHSNENEISPLIYMNTITALGSNLEMNKITAVPRDPTLSTFQTLLGKHILELEFYLIYFNLFRYSPEISS